MQSSDLPTFPTPRPFNLSKGATLQLALLSFSLLVARGDGDTRDADLVLKDCGYSGTDILRHGPRAASLVEQIMTPAGRA